MHSGLIFLITSIHIQFGLYTTLDSGLQGKSGTRSAVKSETVRYRGENQGGTALRHGHLSYASGDHDDDKIDDKQDYPCSNNRFHA
jgi:hypothetical protein